MAGIKAAAPHTRLVRRTITRQPGLGGEDYHAVTPEQFQDAARSGEFCVHWQAHGLFYGIPSDVLHDTRNGVDCLANFSRSALPAAMRVFPKMLVLNITASPHVLAQRLFGRGRESEEDIATRLAQAQKPLPDGLDVVTICNDGALHETIGLALAALQTAEAAN
jgi:ribose 1,5-bisphosphokinase